MITVAEVANVYDLRGLSTDEKPITVRSSNGTIMKLGNGSTFLEMDTGKVYIFDQENES